MMERVFRISHNESGSIAIVVFKCGRGQAKLDGMAFLRGNVFNLSTYRKCKYHVMAEAHVGYYGGST